MKSEIFQECLMRWQNNKGHLGFWDELAEKWGYENGEQLRQKFKYERKKLGIKKEDLIEETSLVVRKNPKILIFDIENSYVKVASWGINKQYINKTQILEDWYMLSYSAKYLYDDKIISSVLTPKEAVTKNDLRICNELWELLNDCDIAITYNGNYFDIPKVNTRFLIHGFKPPSPYKSIDVYQAISRNFAFTCKGMDYVNYMLEVERKMEHEGLSLWTSSMNGNVESLQKMLDYNNQDVVALQETYLRVRPWIRNHPNIGLWHDSKESICGFCGSNNYVYTSNLYSTPTGLYKTFRCNDCGGIGQTPENTLDKDKRKSLMKNI